jgi:hypothetical protein
MEPGGLRVSLEGIRIGSGDEGEGIVEFRKYQREPLGINATGHLATKPWGIASDESRPSTVSSRGLLAMQSRLRLVDGHASVASRY